MSPSLPPLPTNSTMGAGSSPSSSPFSGGLPGMMAAVQQIEGGVSMLARSLPSLAPMLSEFVTKLRMAIPNAVGAGAGTSGAGSQPASPGVPPPPAM